MDGAITLHKDLAESGRWSEMPFAQQMANIGSEVFRAENWKKKGKPARMQNAVDRALELLDFTVQRWSFWTLPFRPCSMITEVRESFCVCVN